WARSPGCGSTWPAAPGRSAPSAGWATCWTAGPSRGDASQQGVDTLGDLINDPLDDVGGLARRVGHLPVEVARTGMQRTRIPAAHGDDVVRATHDLIGQRFGELGHRGKPAAAQDRGDLGGDPG